MVINSIAFISQRILSILIILIVYALCSTNANALGPFVSDWVNVSITTETNEIVTVARKRNYIDLEIIMDGKKFTTKSYSIPAYPLIDGQVKLLDSGVSVMFDSTLMSNGTREVRRTVVLRVLAENVDTKIFSEQKYYYTFSPSFGLCSIEVTDKEGNSKSYKNFCINN